MEKKYGKMSDGSRLIVYKFDSIWSVIDYLEQTADNPIFANDLSSEKGTYSFTKTHSYAEAQKLCLYGGKTDDFSKFMDLKESLDSMLVEDRTRNVQFNDFIGEVPNVPLYLMGYPLNMIRQEKEEMNEDKIIDIYFNVSLPAYTSFEQIYNRGVIALSLIDYLESLGYKVNLHLFELSSCDKQTVLYEFDLKNLDEATDYRNLFFPLTHPSFLRRIIFKLMEKSPELKRAWVDGYGRPASKEMIKEVFGLDNGNKFIFYNPSEMGIYGEDLKADFDRCIETLGIVKKIEEVKKQKK